MRTWITCANSLKSFWTDDTRLNNSSALRTPSSRSNSSTSFLTPFLGSFMLLRTCSICVVNLVSFRTHIIRSQCLTWFQASSSRLYSFISFQTHHTRLNSFIPLWTRNIHIYSLSTFQTLSDQRKRERNGKGCGWYSCVLGYTAPERAEKAFGWQVRYVCNGSTSPSCGTFWWGNTWWYGRNNM